MLVQVDGRRDELRAADALTDNELDDVPGLSGCVETQRAEGQELPTAYPVGSTMCLDEADARLILVTVSGVIVPATRRLEYHAASDYVLEQVLAFSPEAMPHATPAP